MKNFRLSALLCCVSLCGFAACSDDKTDDQPEPQAYQVTQFESSTIPASIPGEGGGYKLTFVIRTETRSTGATFEPWAYRLTLGDAVGDALFLAALAGDGDHITQEAGHIGAVGLCGFLDGFEIHGKTSVKSNSIFCRSRSIFCYTVFIIA